jgi:nicotinate phosphoribosyltransferase
MIETLPRQTSNLSNGLDYYKPTMSQLAYEQEPTAQVVYTLHNRGQQRLMDYVNLDSLQEHLDSTAEHGWSMTELQYLGSLTLADRRPVFSESYLNYLNNSTLPIVAAYHDREIDDLYVETVGNWPIAMLWETIVMSEVSENYFENYLLAHNLNPIDVYNEGDKRLSAKIAVLQAHPNIKIADFGTRRRFSLKWHEHVLERLVGECPANLVGTSNVALAQKYGIKPIGTFAHEMPMVYAALAESRGLDVRQSHGQFLEDWFSRYSSDYSIALTDTFGTDFFFQDFTPDKAAVWQGVRQDSGNPRAFGEQLISFYETNQIDPKTKLVVFSDNLNFRKILELNGQFEGRIKDLYGIGTNLTNDLGITALNIVMKATEVETDRGAVRTVKMSDDEGKHIGPDWLVNKYKNQYFNAA